MGFLENLATLMPEPKRADFLDSLTKMSKEEYAETEAMAHKYYHDSKYRPQMNKLLRLQEADNHPEGRAAQRRRKQMERRRDAV